MLAEAMPREPRAKSPTRVVSVSKPTKKGMTRLSDENEDAELADTIELTSVEQGEAHPGFDDSTPSESSNAIDEADVILRTSKRVEASSRTKLALVAAGGVLLIPFIIIIGFASSGGSTPSPVVLCNAACEVDTVVSDGITCGSRIGHLVSVAHLREVQACLQVAIDEQPTLCGGCMPDNPPPSPPFLGTSPSLVSGPSFHICGAATCTREVIETTVSMGTCGSRIQEHIDAGTTEWQACIEVAAIEHPFECGLCVPDAPPLSPAPPPSQPQPPMPAPPPPVPPETPCNSVECTPEVLSTPAGDSTCGALIQGYMQQHATEIVACLRVGAFDFRNECGGCANREYMSSFCGFSADETELLPCD